VPVAGTNKNERLDCAHRARNLGAFLGVSLVIICTPGPDTALTVRNALVGGRSAGMWTAAGVATGQAVWTIATALGITGLLVSSEPAFVGIKLVGAAYLVYLGCQSLIAALRPETDNGSSRGCSPNVNPNPGPSPGRRGMWQVLVNDLANPKMAAFFMSLLPQFVSTSGPAPFALMALGFTFSLLTFIWLATYSIAIDRFRALFDRSRIRRALDSLAGAVLIGFGVHLAATDEASAPEDDRHRFLIPRWCGLSHSPGRGPGRGAGWREWYP
jgi:threonine/homoserine/homoserine lactone efflux protein